MGSSFVAMENENHYCSLSSLEKEFPRLTSEIRTTVISDAWRRLELSPIEEVKDIIDPPEDKPVPVDRPVQSIKLMKNDEGKYFLLVHKENLAGPLESLVVAFVKCLARLDITISGIVCPQEVSTGAACPTELHPNLKGWITWLANPSSVDWKSAHAPKLSGIINFIDNVVTFGKQTFLSISGTDSRSAMYIKSIQNILCRLFLVDREKWIKGIWHFIPRQLRKLHELKFHNIRVLKSVCILAEVKALPARVAELESIQQSLLDGFLNLSGTATQYKLRRTSDELLSVLGRPALRILYDRLKIRREVAARAKKGEPVKLATILDEGVRTRKWCCMPYMVICAVHRRNIFSELMNSKIPRTFKEDPEDLPFGCSNMLELARFCRKNEDMSPAGVRDMPDIDEPPPIDEGQ